MANDVIIQAQNTYFERRGTTRHIRGFTYPYPTGQTILENALAGSSVRVDMAAAQQALVKRLLDDDETVLPGGTTLKNTQALTPSAFNGADRLELIYNQDPFSTEYEDNTRLLYERQYNVARSAAQSGPSYVRGATARQAYELAELDNEMAINRFREIWQAQLAMAALVHAAVQVAANAEAERWRTMLQAQAQQAETERARVANMLAAGHMVDEIRDSNARYIPIAAELISMPTVLIEEGLTGYGQQGSAQTTFGMNYWR